MVFPLIAAGLSLLPKVPSIWGSIAGLFGKKVPSSIQEAGKLAGEVMNAFKKDEVPPEIAAKLEEIMNEHKEEMAKIALEEHRLEFENAAGMQNLEIESYKSEDEYVRRTRPKILRELFSACVVYAISAPILIVVGSIAGIEATVMMACIGVIKWIGGWLFGTFATAYLGYSGARSLDKRNPALKNGNNLLGKIVKTVL